MTDSTETSDKVDIGTLRQVAKVLGIAAERTWKTEDFLKAIAEKQQERNLPSVVVDENAPKPGFARIIIHRNPDKMGSNSPVHVGLNGKIYQIPRGIPVDIEKEFIEVLQHATSKQPVQRSANTDARNPVGIYSEEENMAYPFQVLAITPGGKFVSSMDNRGPKMAQKMEFVAKYGRYPTEGEFKEFMKGMHTRG